jgi:hypothetical protein
LGWALARVSLHGVGHRGDDVLHDHGVEDGVGEAKMLRIRFWQNEAKLCGGVGGDGFFGQFVAV